MKPDNWGTSFPDPLPESPADFKDVFTEALKRIVKWRDNRKSTTSHAPATGPFEKADQLGLFGLSLSGGGIRSATFNLGVLQTLARLKLLHRVDYLSTVSGGGYIGSWLSAMIHREGAIALVEDGLNPESIKRNTLPQKAIARLRTFSNYLTPQVSLLSADTWTLWTIWFRNTLLNLVILVACTAALVAAARGLRCLAPFFPIEVAFGLCGVLMVMTAVWYGKGLAAKPVTPKLDDGRVQRLVVCPAAGVSILGAFLIAKQAFPDTILWGGAALSILFAYFCWQAKFRVCFEQQHPKQKQWFWLLWAATAAASGFTTSALLHVTRMILESERGQGDYPWFVLTLGPAMVMLAFTLGVMVTMGVMGRDVPDDRREWSGRLAAWALIYTAAWALAFTAVNYGPGLLRMGGAWVQRTVTAAWVGATIGSLMAGNSSKTDGSESKNKGINAMNVVAVIGPWVFLAGFFVAVSLGVHQLTFDAKRVTLPPMASAPAAAANTAQATADGCKITVTIGSNCCCDNKKLPAPKTAWETYWAEMAAENCWKSFTDWPNGGWHEGLGDLALICALLGVFASWRVDINEFSLHHFYKNRLVRCYMGASRESRDPNPFTGFDARDDLRLNYLDIQEHQGPFHILNATLNLSSGRNLAWQERQGAPFIFTPVYSGYDVGSNDSGTSASRRARVGVAKSGNAYWPTRLLAKMDVPDDDPDKASDQKQTGGIMIGTAAAISGAAASPNQGFHTSTAVAFLMTVFNTRLGWWLGNTANPYWAQWTSPIFGLPYTVMELFGSTTAENNFVNLSDGGFFDNMGLYELVRRRCKYIVVCDAEQDGDLNFGGITSAIRMCRTDFGVEIDLPLEQIRKRSDGWSGVHAVKGTIRYKAPTPNGQSSEGVLVYLKSSLTGREPADVIGYHRMSTDFPHESTGDQWFSESQFESYRKLGEYIATAVFAGPNLNAYETAADKDGFFQSIEPA